MWRSARVLVWNFGLFAVAGCGGSDTATPTDRLWVSAVPTSAKQELSAFVTTRTSEGKYVGAFFHGSALRGSHDVFEWKDSGKDAATLRFLQDGRQTKVRFETCSPSRGFDFCLLVHGDPTGAKKYQSRKRWNVRRGKKAAILSIPAMFEDLAEDDEELARALVTDDVELP